MNSEKCKMNNGKLSRIKLKKERLWRCFVLIILLVRVAVEQFHNTLETGQAFSTK